MLRRYLDSWWFIALVVMLLIALVVNNYDAFEQMITLLFTWEP